MAGSYNHVVKNKTGALEKPERVLGMLDCYHGDVYEAIEEMYGMIWYLATIAYGGEGGLLAPEEFVEDARKHYLAGLAASPTKRFGTSSDYELQKLKEKLT